MKEIETVGEAYRWASSFLREQGGSSPLFEAELLLRFALGWDRTRFFMQLDHPLSGNVLRQFREWVEQRGQGVPVQYIIGEQEFYGRVFRVNPSVLIPRPETEILAETVLKEAESYLGRTRLTVADIGTGSGALAVTLAAEKPDWCVIAVDRSRAALDTARANARLHGVESRIQWMEGDWLTPLTDQGIRVDVLVSNPPYIPSGVIARLEKQVRDYEPRLALDGGPDGLDPYRIIVSRLPRVIRLPGWVAFETGEGQSADVCRLLRRFPGKVETSVVRDLAGKDRVVTARLYPGNPGTSNGSK